jgi:hypothetical protein
VLALENADPLDSPVTPSPLSQSVPEYRAYMADHPQWFSDAGAQLGNGWTLVAVNVPTTTPAECAHAAQAAAH